MAYYPSKDPAYVRLVNDQREAKKLEEARRAKALLDYNDQYAQNLRDLGWQSTATNPALAGATGNWDYSGRLSKSGQAFRSLMGSLSARGAGRSTEADAQRQAMNEQFSRQKADIAGAQAKFGGQQADYTDFNNQQLQARNDLLARLAANRASSITNANKRTAGI